MGVLLGPAVGDLAEGPSDMPGRMVEPDEIAAYAVRILRSPGSAFAGKRVVVTAGATREHIDPVRVVNDFPRDRSVELEKKLTTRALEELSSGGLTYRLIRRRRQET